MVTPWDRFFPLWPIWVIPYLLSLPWWAACLIWAACKMDDALYRAFVVSLLVVMLFSYAVYIVYPTYVIRPAAPADDWLSQVISWLYAHDRVNNAFPSGHAYNTMLITFFWWRWRPRQRWLWFAIAAVILLSTLYTRQHNLADLAGGIVVAWLGYRLGLWWTARRSQRV